MAFECYCCYFNVVVTFLFCSLSVYITYSAVHPLGVIIDMNGESWHHKSTLRPAPFLILNTGHVKTFKNINI